MLERNRLSQLRIEPLKSCDLLDSSEAGSTELKGQVEGLSSLVGTVAHSPAALECFRSSVKTKSRMRISPRMREAIGLRVSQLNASSYCLAAHTSACQRLGLSHSTIHEYSSGRSDDSREQALLAFVTKVVGERGHHCRFVFEVARKLGVTDEEVLEVITLVALYTFSNYVCSVANIGVDFGQEEEAGNAPHVSCSRPRA